MASTILADNGVSSGSAGLKSTADSTGVLALQTTTSGGAVTTAVTVDNAQNVGIGVTPSAWGSSYKAIQITPRVGLFGNTSDTILGNNLYNDGTNWKYIATATGSLYLQGSGINAWYTAASGTAGSTASLTQAMTLDASGNLLVGQTAQTTTEKLGITNSGNNDGLYVINGSATPTGYGITSNLTNATGTVTNTAFLYRGRSNGADRFYVYGNGGIGNYSANNVNLSDERTKTDIQDAGNYLAKICAIPVRTFKYKDQTDDLLNLGCIAQEVEAVAPELVDASGFGETPEDGVPLKAIYQTDLQYALMKCIQEQQALITSLTERITALEAK
jgi:hypothetical protein